MAATTSSAAATTSAQADRARYEELDALRGIAAVVVMFSHLLLVLPYFGGTAGQSETVPFWVTTLGLPPFAILWGGTEAVVLFFVLSGFVLALPFFQQRVSVTSFLVRRAIRIYLPYLVAVAFGLLFIAFVPRVANGEFSLWFHQIWSHTPDFDLIVDHILLLPSFDNDLIMPVVWSLVVEARVSLIFPLLMWLVLRLPISLVFGLTALTYIVGRFLHWYVNSGALVPTDVFQTLMHLFPFVVGIILAQTQSLWRERLVNLSVLAQVGLWVIALALMQYRAFLPDSLAVISRAMAQFPTLLGCVLMVVLALGGSASRAVLVNAPLLWLGKISYSLYLIHTLVITSLVYLLAAPGLFEEGLPLGFVLVFSAFLSVVMADIFYRLFETPSVQLAKRAGIWFEQLGKEGRIGIRLNKGSETRSS